ncbi:MAG: sulfatase-like hydrolase/transferase [Planctomycetes bacterium]|nr:sulfatase-like hydrolase/transferase [Planctomycetota bacterium]
MRKDVVNYWYGILLCFLFLLIIPRVIATDKLPNFVFIYGDDQGWNAMSHRTNPDIPGSGSDWFETPSLDQLANEGMRYSRAYSPGPTCSPSRHSLQWGRSPAHLKIFGADGIRESDVDARPEDSLANTLKKAHPEYSCAHFGKWHICYNTDDLGFAVNDGNNGNLRKSPDKNDPKYIFSLSKKANDFMEQQVKEDKPFFLQISHYADHLDYEALEETVEKYKNKADQATEYHNDPLWAAMNENLDTGIGIVLDKIDELGIRDSTYIIYTADNGYECKKDGSHKISERKFYKAYPQRSHKYTVSEGGIRVPFIVRGPGIPAGVHSEDHVVGTDIFPTILDFVGSADSIPESVEGTSLVKHLRSGGKVPLQRKEPYLVFKHSKPRAPYDATLIQGDYKYMCSLLGNESYLFNLREDMGEAKDLSGQYPEKTAEMKKLLFDYLGDKGWDKTRVENVVSRKSKKKSKKKKAKKM